MNLNFSQPSNRWKIVLWWPCGGILRYVTVVLELPKNVLFWSSSFTPPALLFPHQFSTPHPSFPPSFNLKSSLHPDVSLPDTRHRSVKDPPVMLRKYPAHFPPHWKKTQHLCVCVCACKWTGWLGHSDWHEHPSTESMQRACPCHAGFSQACPHQLYVVDNWDISTHTFKAENISPPLKANTHA